MRQRRHAHGHALALLRFGRARGGEANADHLVDGGEEPKLGLALEVPASDGGGGWGGVGGKTQDNVKQ